MVKLTPTGVKINTNLVWTSHNMGGVEFNTGVFAVFIEFHKTKKPKTKQTNKQKKKKEEEEKKNPVVLPSSGISKYLGWLVGKYILLIS